MILNIVIYFLCLSKHIQKKNMEDSFIDTFSEIIIKDEPKITTATKNFISVILAESLNPNNDYEMTISNFEALSCARIFLKSLNQFVLPDVVEWGNLNKQNESQLGIERMEELTKYKVIKSLSDISKLKNGKVSTLYGKLFFDWTKCYHRLCESIMKDYSNTKSTTTSPNLETLQYFLNRFGDSFDTDNEISELVWSVDLVKILKERSLKREIQAKQRCEDEKNTKVELKNLIEDSSSSHIYNEDENKP